MYSVPEIEHANGGLKRLRELGHELNQQDARELHYSRLWTDSGIGIALVARNGTFLLLNNDYAKLLHVPVEMAIGTRWQDYTPEPDLSKDQHLVDQCIAGLLDGYTLPKLYGAPGNYSYVLMRVSAIRNELGELLYFFVTAQDLNRTEMLRMLQELDD